MADEKQNDQQHQIIQEYSQYTDKHSNTQLINTEHRKVSLNRHIYTVYIDIYRKADLLWREQSHFFPLC